MAFARRPERTTGQKRRRDVDARRSWIARAQGQFVNEGTVLPIALGSRDWTIRLDSSPARLGTCHCRLSARPRH